MKREHLQNSRWMVRQLLKSDSEIYLDLLKKSYGTAKGFGVRTEGLYFNESDAYYPNWGVFENNKLVSCMKAEWMLSEKEVQFKVQGASPYILSPVYPMMFLTKAATLPDLKFNGFNLLLRYYFFKLAEVWNTQYILGTMVPGSPRIFTLTELGYQFSPAEKKWDQLFVSEDIPLIACLDFVKHKSSALKYIENKIPDLLQDTAFQIDLTQIEPASQRPFPNFWEI